LREKLVVALAPDFGEAFERKPGGFADPCAKHDFVIESGRRFVVNLVAQYDPPDRRLSFGAGKRSPMRGGDILHPSQVNGVVHVILLIDIARKNRNCHFESGGYHK
jgi:hypothetical protein